MAEVDTSSYGKNLAKPMSPLETLSGVAGLQNTMNQNKLFQQEFKSKLGLNRIYKEAIDPNTGELDVSKLQGLMGDPNVTMGLPQAYQNSQEAQKRNLEIKSAQVDNWKKHIDATSAAVAPFMKPGKSSAELATTLAQLKTNGVLNDQQVLDAWMSIPRDPKTHMIDETKIPEWAQAQQMKNIDSLARLNMYHPKPEFVDLPGGGKAPFSMPQMGSPQQVGPTIQAAASPTTQVFGPDGVPRYVGAPQGNNPYEPRAQGGTGPAAGGGMPAQAGGGIAGQAAGMSPAASAASAESGKFSAQQGTTLQGRSDRVADNKAILGNLESELSAPGFETGPGTSTVAKLAKFVNAQTGFEFRAEGLSAREQFNKLAGMLAQSQFQALGGTGTDAKLDSATLTSPNSELSKLGNKGIIALLKGNEDAIAAKNQAWQAWQQANGPQSYGQFSVQFNKSYDPRVFQSQYLDGANKQKLLKGMTEAEQKAFRNSYNTAVTNGWIPDPRGK